MARRTFKNWWCAYTKLLSERLGWSEQTISTLDKDAFKETYFNDGFTIEEAYQDELYYSN